MRTFLSLFLVFSLVRLSGQQIVVTAQNGDGIFSILRKQGLDPVKYYADFVKLNQKNLKNGSELYLGREYIIPEAPDSFKKMAVQLEAPSDSENAIFDEKALARVSPKSDHLKNAVIYLLPGEGSSLPSLEIKALKKQIFQRLASQLMVHGARVYLIENDTTLTIEETESTKAKPELERPIGNQKQLQHYVDAINQRYLKNHGKYQRVLVINFKESLTNNKYFKVSIFHHINSIEGEHFAKSLQDIFNQSSSTKRQSEFTEVFKNQRNLFLAKNLLPPITMIDIIDSKSPGYHKRTSVATAKRELPELITSGVLKDYADLSFEND